MAVRWGRCFRYAAVLAIGVQSSPKHPGLGGRRSDSDFPDNMFPRIAEWRKRAGVLFWRLADKRISKEWLVFLLGGMVLLVYVFVLFFGTRPRK